MNKYLYTLIALLAFSAMNADALQIVYPKTKDVTINSPVTAFIGNELKFGTLKINGSPVKIHSSGGFKHGVELKYGINKFTITNGSEAVTYSITRQYNKPSEGKKMYNSFNEPILLYTSQYTPLRSTPVDGGINRLQHLQSEIPLKAIGEYGDFYKVQLARDDFAWISKIATKISKETNFDMAVLENIDHCVTDTQEIFRFKLSKRVPYILTEEKTGFNLTLYNMNDEAYHFGKYEFSIPMEQKKFGYESYYTDNVLVVKLNKFIPNVKKITITIDAGHGGAEFGAIGCLGNKEKDFNLDIAKRLKNVLSDAGANVIMTRDTDVNVSLSDRVKIANDNNSQIFISIHANALPDSLLDKDISGTEVYYFYNQSKNLAEKIQNSLVQKLGTKNGGVKQQSFAVVRNTNALSILVETGYMINPEENSKLMSEDFKNNIVQGIKEGVEKYLNDI